MAKPKLALIPATQGSKLYSVLPADGVGDFDFSRNTIATRINSQGLIETVASGVSRLNYPLIDGVVNGCPSHLLEPEILQKIQYSEDFSQGYWNKSLISVTQNNSVSPNGLQTADKIVSGNSTGSHFFRRTGLTYSATNNTFSVFAKFTDDLFKEFHFVIYDGSNHFAYFDVKDGVVSSADSGITASMVNYGNGWYRCIATYQTLSTSGGQIKVELGDSTSVTGDGSSGMFFWGMQWEVANYATSYIPNYGTSAGVTRSAETAIGAGDASTFNDSEGVLMAEISALSDDDSARKIAIVEGSTQNQVSIGYSTSTKKIRAITYDGALKGETFTNVYDVLSSNKVAYKYKSGDNVLWVNGFALDTSSDTNILDGITLNSLNFDANSSDFYGNVKQLQYFDSALNDSDLETLTSWTSFTDLANGQLYTIE